MATLSISPADKALSLLVSSFKDLSVSVNAAETPTVSQLALPNATVSGTNTIASHLASLIPLFASATYSDLETAEVEQWLTLSAVSPIPAETLDALNATLKFRTTILGEKWSIADVVVYARVKDVVAAWSDEERTGEKGRHYVVRWVDFVQNSPELGLNIPAEEKVKIDASKVLHTPKPEEAPKKEKKPAAAAAAAEAVAAVEEKGKKTVEAAKEGGKKVKDAAGAAAAAAQGKKTEKKQKPKREPAPPKEEPALSPSAIDLRVGHILYCRPHPNADSLFVSTIAMGDAVDSPIVTPHSEITDLPASVLEKYSPLPPVRTVCSGLNGLVPLEEMQDRKVICVANLKPVTMRGIKSAAMVLAASPRPPPGEEAAGHKKEYVELVAPPEGAQAGEKVFFEGYEGTPEAQLNPKKKVWEQIQPGFKTADDQTVAFDRALAGWVGEGEKGKATGADVAKLVTASGGVCKAPTLKGATIS
ncbi:hypothetical protein FN846DRAFT_788666 [Sphaerosporella brunnea]|uniref:tRNA-binding domain-containing protein n=1 Tax=Sphaerosporella brunnea TaxID=1250544 RepID=A0A5J5EBE5_9PEZI|nr:hypothetical protein FN846DRAFT_788666 [Sphaerosporella brunnea]